MRWAARWAWVAMLSLVAIFPAAKAQEAPEEPLCVILFAPSGDFSTVDVTADLLLADDEMRRLRGDVDRDGDGMTTAGEVAAHEAESHHDQTDVRAMEHRRLWRDEAPPENLHIWTELVGFEGSTDGQRDLLVQEHRHYAFGPTAGRTHLLRGGGASEPESRPVVEYVVVQAPEGWLVTAVNGQPYRNETVDLPSFDTWDDFTFTFEDPDWRPPGRGIPAAPWPTVLGFLILAAWRRPLCGARACPGGSATHSSIHG